MKSFLLGRDHEDEGPKTEAKLGMHQPLAKKFKFPPWVKHALASSLIIQITCFPSFCFDGITLRLGMV